MQSRYLYIQEFSREKHMKENLWKKNVFDYEVSIFHQKKKKQLNIRTLAATFVFFAENSDRLNT